MVAARRTPTEPIVAKPAKRTQKTNARKAAANTKPQRDAGGTAKKSTKTKITSNAPEQAPKASGKLSNVLHLMRRKEGATIADLQKVTGWQSHSVRAALTGIRKRGVEIARSKNGDA
jgi:hypothetical protein